MLPDSPPSGNEAPRIDATEPVAAPLHGSTEVVSKSPEAALEGQLMENPRRKWSDAEKAAIVERVIERVAEADCTVSQAAVQLGVNERTIRLWCLEEMPEEYRASQKRANLLRLVEAEIMMEKAQGHIEVAQARELMVHHRWILERTWRERFAQRTEVTGAGGGPVELTEMDRARRIAFLQRVLADQQRAEGQESGK